jgi:energy-coupling factor transport system ATP-binding protein
MSSREGKTGSTVGTIDSGRKPLLSIEHVSYRYPDQRRGEDEHQAVATISRPKSSDESVPIDWSWALRDINLRVEQGEYIALLGHNGSGKSTLARHCNALLLPDEGQVFVDGMDTRDTREQRAIRERVGMIFQNPDNQLIATVVEDDVAWGLTMRGLPLDAIRERVDTAMEAVGIAHLRQFPPHQLSGGQRQRLAIAGILALRPQCIIADEATSMLDPLSRQELVHLLAQLHRDYGLTIIHVTHLLEEVVFAQRLVIMEHGMIVQEGTPEAVFADLLRLRALGLVVPDPLLLADRLRESGIPIASNAVSMDAIAREIVQR